MAQATGSRHRYFQSGVNTANKLVPTGITGRVAYKGSLGDDIFQMLGGLTSGMGYVGAPLLQTLQDNAQLLQITGAGLRTSTPTHVQITRTAPNYSVQ